MFRLAVIIALSAFAVAQSPSQQCTNALAAVAADPNASRCLAIGAFLPVVAGGSNSSIVQPFNNWLGSMCSAPACTNATLEAAFKNFTTGCSTDLSSMGVTSDDLSSLTPTILQLYPTVRKMSCLRKQDNSLCLTETLTNIESVTGPLTLSNLVKLSRDPPTSLPSNITCTDCIKESYNILFTDVPSTVSSTKPSLESKCGASFVDGQHPSGITQSANTAIASTSTTSPALSIFADGVTMAVGASGLIVSIMYTIFS